MPPGFRDVLQGTYRESTLEMSVHAALFRDRPRNASVATTIEIAGRTLAFDRKGPEAPFEDTLRMYLFATDDEGAIVQDRSPEFAMKLSPEYHHSAVTFGVRMNPRLRLPQGRYRLYVVACESGAPAGGAIHCDLDVPDFTSDPLMLSDVLLTATSASLSYTVEPDMALGRCLPGPATSKRDFVRGDMLGAFAEVYTNSSDLAARVVMTTDLIDESGRLVFSASEPPHGFNGGNRHGEQRRYLVHVPLRTASLGRHVLRVEARLPATSGSIVAHREVHLTVRADPGWPHAPTGSPVMS
jgi:hypothetical protein